MKLPLKYIVVHRMVIRCLALFCSGLLIMALTSCKKNNPEPPKDKCNCPMDNECFDFEKNNSPGFGLQYIADTIQNTSPCFNPNNPAEIVFIKNTFQSQTLIKYNLATKEKTILYEGTVFSQPKWSVKNWIIFWGPNSQIWKIRADGTGLTMLTTGYANYRPEWSPDGKRFCYEKVIDTIINGRFTAMGVGAIADENGKLLDRIDSTTFGSYSSWGENNIILIGPKTNGLYIYNTDSQSLERIPWTFCSEITVSSSLWINRFEPPIWIDPLIGLFKSDITSNTHTCIAKNCASRQYNFFSHSKQLNKIIVDCIISTKPVNNKTYYKSVLYLMNSDGTDKQLIDIP